ncbi:MAG: hypothetical protein PVJ21_20055 [Anaerolineales bacterium]|jgi:hypothetical protein
MSKGNTPLSTSRFGIYSIILMFVPILFVVVISFILEPFVSNLSNTIQRIMAILTLFLPAVLGFVLAIVGLVRKERRKWIHIIGLIINLLESLYFGLLVLIAG